MNRLLTGTLLALCLCAPALAQKVDPEMERLRSQLRALDEEPTFGALAPAERLLAQQAIEALAAASRRERADALLVAERRLDIARAAAEAEAWQEQIAQLERERDLAELLELVGDRRELVDAARPACGIPLRPELVA